MFDLPGSRLSPEEFSARLDEAKARAVALRREALRDLGSSVVTAAAAAGRRVARALRRDRAAPSPVRAAAQPAR